MPTQDAPTREEATGEGAGPRARRGRPAEDPAAREARILDALEQVVAQAGLAGASMAAIARAAGISKRTLYTTYPSRDALFGAWIRRLRASLVRPLGPEARALPLPDRLRALLRREALSGASDPRLTALRAIVAEAPRNPALAAAFLREGTHAARAIVAQELARAADDGDIALADPAQAAEMLCDMAWTNPLERLIDVTAPDVAPEAADARLDFAIGVFLHGLARTAAG